MKFLSLFQEADFDLEETGAFFLSPDYQKSLLILKLPSEYHSMTIPLATKVDWDQYVADLIAFLVAIEKEDTKLYRDVLNLNVNSDRSGKEWTPFWASQLLIKVLSQPSSGPICLKTRRSIFLQRNGL